MCGPGHCPSRWGGRGDKPKELKTWKKIARDGPAGSQILVAAETTCIWNWLQDSWFHIKITHDYQLILSDMDHLTFQFMLLSAPWKWACYNLPAARTKISKELLNLCQLWRRAHTFLRVSTDLFTCVVSPAAASPRTGAAPPFKRQLSSSWDLFCILTLCLDSAWCFLLRVDSWGLVYKQIHPVWLGAQPKCCGKAKEFEQRGKNAKGNNRISGAVWAVGTGNASVLGEDWYLLSSPEPWFS